MMDLLQSLFSWTFFTQCLEMTVPLALAALGGVVSERSGVINIALEGKLLVGAFTACLGSYYGGFWVGVLAGIGGGMLFAALYALAVIRFRADQIVCGVALNMIAFGLTRYLLEAIFESSANSPRVPGLDVIWKEPLFYLIVALILAFAFLFERTAFGLRVAAVGERPDAADALGVSVVRVRTLAVLSAGALAGLGGAWLCLDHEAFSSGMSAGGGFIALAAVIIGKWRPKFAACACLLFGFTGALAYVIQNVPAIDIPNELSSLFPYVVTIITVAGFVGRSPAPRAIGKPWTGE
jgi:simple sugar transport system permease protein